MSAPGAIIGIDLGTTNSCVAAYQGHAPHILLNAEGQRTTPSAVAFADGGKVLVGSPAQRQAVMNPRNTFSEVKRLIGRPFDSSEVRMLKELLPYEIVKAPNGDAWARAGDRSLSVPEIQAYLLERLRIAAESALGLPVTRAVVTVPAYFDEAQRQATRDAATIAGLEVQRILNEPTAAALAFGLHQADGNRIAVIDLGGGTFDVTLLLIEDGVFEVLGTTGDMLLGGGDFDRRIAMHLRDEIHKEHGVDVSGEPMAAQRLLDGAEGAKKQLSELLEAHIVLPFLFLGPKGPISVSRTLRRDEFDSMTRDLVDRLEAPCQTALGDARLAPGDIDHVILVGGMTRVPAVQRKVAEIFGRPPSKGINPDEAVALGAALETAILDGHLEGKILIDVAPHTIGVRAAGDRFAPVVRRATPIPTRVRKVFATTENNQDHVNMEVWQGENAQASKNRFLSRLRLAGLPPAPKGQVHVEVTFSVNASGLLSVTAKDMTTGKEARVEVTAKTGLTREEVQRLRSARTGS